jgi:hypothetical protein
MARGQRVIVELAGDNLAKECHFCDVRVSAPFVAEGGALVTDGNPSILKKCSNARALLCQGHGLY